MRMLLALTLLLLTCSSVAQNVMGNESKRTFSINPVPGQNFNPSIDVGKNWIRPANPNAGCFFIRSYNFERRGTAAPKLKNMTTCTPAKSDQFRQTGKKPQVRLIPAK